MKKMKIFILLASLVVLSACGSKPANTTITTAPSTAAPASAPGNKPMLQPSGQVDPEQPDTAPPTTKDGTYKGHGKVTRVSNDLGSIEIEHDDIPGLMPAMKMEFHVQDKAMLNGIFANDEVNFVIEYKQGQEKITSLTKVKKGKKDDE